MYVTKSVRRLVFHRTTTRSTGKWSMSNAYILAWMERCSKLLKLKATLPYVRPPRAFYFKVCVSNHVWSINSVLTYVSLHIIF